MEYDKFISRSFNNSSGLPCSPIDVLNNSPYSLRTIKHKDTIIAPFLRFGSSFESLVIKSDGEYLTPINICVSKDRLSYRGPVTFIRSAPRLSELKKISLKDTEYYTSQGIICLSDLTPLLISYIVLKKHDTKYAAKEVVVFISTSVYDRDDAISKNIRSTAIKGLSQCSITLHNRIWNYGNLPHLDWGEEGGRYDDSECLVPVEIVLTKDFSDVLVRPTVPDINFNKDSIDKFLASNVDDIMNEWK